MRMLIKITGDDVPDGGLIMGVDPAETALDQFIRDLRLAYPGAHHRVVHGLDVVTDVVAGDAE